MQRDGGSEIIGKLIKLVQWANYQGGLAFMFIIFGMIFIAAFGAVSFWERYNWIALAIGVFFFCLGLYMKFKWPNDKM